MSDTERAEIRERAELPMTVRQSHEPDVFFIKVTGSLGGKTAAVTIRTYHTNITRIEENGVTILSTDDVCADAQADGEAWSIPELIKAARVMPLMEAETLLNRQIDCDSANQGITASAPVLIFARALKKDRETTLRAVLLSDLVTIALKQGIGKLSAYCGAVSAGCGSGAGIGFLEGLTDKEILGVIRNALAITSGILCDGAKSSCAAKISMAVEGALLALDMVKNHQTFKAGDGIVQSTTDSTARAVGRIASCGMVSTDREIIEIPRGNPRLQTREESRPSFLSSVKNIFRFSRSESFL